MCFCASSLTDDRAAPAASGEIIVEDDEEHDEAEHQSDLESVAFTAPQRQGEADDVGQHDQDTGHQ